MENSTSRGIFDIIQNHPVDTDAAKRWHIELANLPTSGTTCLFIRPKALHKRLLSSLPAQPPRQILLFKAFYEGFASAIPRLRVLLLEVWLRWNPKTVQQRGRDALLRFRVDFLLLLPYGIRIVIGVDGKQHYAREDGMAEVQRYGQMVAADRDLKLAGYEVFHFGAAELGRRRDDQSKQIF